MKRFSSLLLALLLLTVSAAALAQAPGGTQSIVCEELQFSTLAPEDASVYQQDGAVFIDLSPYNAIPYIEIDKVMGQRYDTASYLSDTLVKDMESRYGDALRGTSIMEYYTVGGKNLPAAQFSYKVGDYTVYFLQAVELTGNDTVFYTAKFIMDYRDDTLSALDLAVRYYQADAHYYDTVTGKPPVNDPAPVPTAAPKPVAAEGVYTTAMNHLSPEDLRVAQCAAPVGYEISALLDNCGPTRNFNIPVGVNIIVTSPDKKTFMTYESPSCFLEIVSSTRNGQTVRTQENGKMDPETLTLMGQYPQPNAYAYAYLEGMFPNVEISYMGSADMSPYQSLFKQNAQKKYDALRAGHPELVGLNIDWVAVDGDICAFSGEMHGESYAFIVGAVIEATQSTATMAQLQGTLVETEILWTPLCTYVLGCPVSELGSAYPAFEVFMANTTVSDEFIQTIQALSSQLAQIIADGRMQSGASYCYRALQTASASGETYDDERFTDYIFDQNDYTLSDGSHVKISTAYDYVYEGDNGVVYYSDSAFPEPGAKLTPNR